MDLRQWIQQMEETGQLKQVLGADLDTEIGVLTDLFQEKMGEPALLFDQIPGYMPGQRVITNTMTSQKRLALTLGIAADACGLELVSRIKEKMSRINPLKLQEVEKGPVLDNVLAGDRVDLYKIPVPKLHEKDGGRYIGTGCFVIMKDPDSGWVNVGTYRVMVSDSKTCTMHIVTGRHAWAIRNKYWQRGKACPVAIATGSDPLIYLLSGMEMPWGENEMELAGSWRQQPVSVIAGPTTGLPIPADAEIVIEGFMPPEKTLPEGPFGEWRGYYSKQGGTEPTIDVSALLFRNDPILVTSAPRIPPSDTTYPRGILRAALVWHQLTQAGIPGISGCWMLPSGGDRPLLAVRMKQLYPGHAKQAGMMAAFCPAFNYGGLMVVVVDEHIDITDPAQIFWALAVSFNPGTDIQVLNNTWGNPVFKEQTGGPAGVSSRVVLDATIPWPNRDKIPPLVKASPDLVKQAKEKWPQLFV